MSVASVPVSVILEPRSSSRSRSAHAARASRITVRSARESDVAAVYSLVTRHMAEGGLLPRTREEIGAHVGRFVVAIHRGRLIGCADLARLSRGVAEIRSLVVSHDSRSLGLGKRLVTELKQRATTAGFVRLCAFTHNPALFLAMGFSIVTHGSVPEKVEVDCRGCAAFGNCAKYAVLLPLKKRRRRCAT